MLSFKGVSVQILATRPLRESPQMMMIVRESSFQSARSNYPRNRRLCLLN